MTQCSGEQLAFHGLGKRRVVGCFDGGAISSDGGALLAAAAGKRDPSGHGRTRARDKGEAQASSSTLNRLELTPEDAEAKAAYDRQTEQAATAA